MSRDLQKDLEICNKATPGPWEWQMDRWHGGYTGLAGQGDIEVLYPSHENDGDDGAAWFDEFPSEADAEFIVQAREGWPEAINRAIKAEAEVERLKKHLRWATDTEGTYKCQNCQNLVESEYTNRLFCSYHSEGEYQHETFLDDYCSYFESKKEGE